MRSPTGTYTPTSAVFAKTPSLELVDEAKASLLEFDPATRDDVVKLEKPIIPPTYGLMRGPGVPNCRPTPPLKMELVVVTSTLIKPSAPPPSGTRRVSLP